MTQLGGIGLNEAGHRYYKEGQRFLEKAALDEAWRGEEHGDMSCQQCLPTDHSLHAGCHAENSACLSSCYLQRHHRRGEFFSHFPNGETEVNRNNYVQGHKRWVWISFHI